MTNNRDTIIKSALANLNITTLNPMQVAALEASQSNKDLVLLSPTGSGKTLAFLLPLLLKLKQDDNTIQAMVLTPSRELAIQIDGVFKSMNTKWKTCCCYGGHSIGDEKRSILGNNPSIIIGTPGRILDHLSKGNFNPQTITTLIIDEFDKSLEFGFHDEMTNIISQLTSLTSRVLLSATDAKEIPEFAGVDTSIKLNFLLDDCEVESRLTLKKVHSPARDKAETLYRLLCTLGRSSSIVFCNHRDAVERVNSILQENGLFTERFHGGMEQPERERAIYKYRNGSCNILVSTDLASRGLDIPEVEHVIHYHLPIKEDAYTHRNGRTARWDATGTSYLILCDEEEVPTYIDTEVETYQLPDITPAPPKSLWTTLYFGKGKKDKLGRGDIAGFLYKCGGVTRDDVGQIDVSDHFAFVAVRRDIARDLLKSIKREKIKGMKVLIEFAR